MKNKSIYLLLVMVLVVSLFAGCGKETSSTEETKETQATSKEEVKTTEAEQTAEVTNTTLKWAVWDIASTTYYQPLIDAYKEVKPNVTIEMV